jgi:MFS family permease
VSSATRTRRSRTSRRRRGDEPRDDHRDRGGGIVRSATATRPAPRLTYRWVVLAAAAATQVAFSALQTGLPALGPALRDELRLSLAELGVVLGATTLGTVGTVYGWGLLADRFGERRVLVCGLLGTAGALAWGSAAPSAAALAMALFLAGALGGCTTAASARAVMGWFGPEERGLALSARHTGVPVGAAVAALSLPALAAVAGVSWAFLALAGLAAAGAAAAGLLIRDPPAPAGNDDAAVAAPDAPPPRRDRRLWRLALGCALLIGPQYSLGAFFPVFLHDVQDWSQAAAGGGLALALGLSAVGRLAAGRWSDRRGHRVAPLRALALAGAGAAALAALLADAAGVVVVPVLLAALVVLWSWNGVAFAAAGELAAPGRAGAALGLLMTVLFGVGAIGPPLFGAAVEAGSWAAGLGAVALSALGGWLVLAPLSRRAVPTAGDRGLLA